MTEKCEFIIASRAIRGEPLLCGRQGVPYVILGGVANTTVTLCLKHMEIMAKHGYGIEVRNSTKGAIAYPQRPTPESRSETTGGLPLFDLPEEQ